MVEILLLFMLPVILMPQIAAGILAKQTGRKFWFWFWVSFVIPFISLIILVSIEDKSKKPDQIDSGD
ncbi:hypothetical protein [Pedobacter miscanthi]|uniref:Uncharacterized protein n=1 Tax=Pedobacter miscanthi TaxID=2259170 RepID=A0A366KZS0_9SPHI|nr:hypothetical protein [Pedobacter miscanthi]RBQ06739.1 hypothetical protein DRW42_13240 [Pedobacter miscanthi]